MLGHIVQMENNLFLSLIENDVSNAMDLFLQQIVNLHSYHWHRFLIYYSHLHPTVTIPACEQC
jgi:hypothetical protein